MLSVTLSTVLSPDSAPGSPLKRYNHATGPYKVVQSAAAVTDLNQRFQLTLTQAGHPNPVSIQDGKDLTKLGGGGAPVGLLLAVQYDTIHATVCPDDRLVLYSGWRRRMCESAGSTVLAATIDGVPVRCTHRATRAKGGGAGITDGAVTRQWAF
jgi:hypothetical protein